MRQRPYFDPEPPTTAFSRALIRTLAQTPGSAARARRASRLLASAALLLPLLLGAQPLVRVSVDSAGLESNGASATPALAADGSAVVFSSDASNLVATDTNGVSDVFVHDLITGMTSQASVGEAGAQADGRSIRPSISSDGRLVAFESRATNLVPGDENGNQDAYVHDRDILATRRVSVLPGPIEADRTSSNAVISGNGSFVAFDSSARNLVAGDDNDERDVFLADSETGAIERLSQGLGGAETDGRSRSPAVSADGSVTAFASTATNLVPGDGNGVFDVFAHDRTLGTIERISVALDGSDANAASDDIAMSADGRFIAFTSGASNLVPDDLNGTPDVFVRDRTSGITERISVGPGDLEANDTSFGVAISADGRFVAFTSFATNLVDGDTNNQLDVFIHDRQTGSTDRVSLGAAGAESNGPSSEASLSGDGRFVAFRSEASNLVAGDDNGVADIFVRDRLGGQGGGADPIPVPPPPAAAAADRAGEAVGVVPGALAVGVPGSERVVLYDLSGPSPVVAEELVAPPDTAPGFGSRLDLSEEYLIVGTAGAGGGGRGQCSTDISTLILARLGLGLTEVAQLKGEQTCGGGGLAYADSVVLVGSPVSGTVEPFLLDATGANPGPVIFPLPFSKGDGRNRAYGKGDEGLFGFSVAYLQGKAAIGAPVPEVPDAIGTVHLFGVIANNIGVSVQPAATPVVAGEPGDGFGSAVAVSGSVLAVGAPERSGRDGAVDVFLLEPLFSPGGKGELRRVTIEPPPGDEAGRFGTSVSLFGNILTVGASGLPTFLGGQGAVYVYDVRELVLRLRSRSEAPAGAIAYGADVAVDEEGAIAIGAPDTDVETGAAFVRYGVIFRDSFEVPPEP